MKNENVVLKTISGKWSVKKLIFILIAIMLLSIAAQTAVSASDKFSLKGSVPSDTVSPDIIESVVKTQRVIVYENREAAARNLGFSIGINPDSATCCTHWNSSTGGTGCASFEGSCPDNTFSVNCGENGCW